MCGVVGARIRYDKDVDELRRVILLLNRLHEIGDNGLFVVSRDKKRVAVLLVRGRKFNLTVKESDKKENNLIEKAKGKQTTDNEVKSDDRRHAKEVK